MIGNSTHNENENKAFTDRLDINFVLKAARLGVWEFNLITRQVHWNDRCRELFGLTSGKQASYEQINRHVHPDDIDRVDAAIKRATKLHSDGKYDITYRTIGADDSVLRWGRFMGQVEFSEKGEALRFAGIALNVTEDELARQLIVSEERFRTMVGQAPMAIALFSGRDFVLETANEHALAFLRKDSRSIGLPLIEITPEIEAQGFITMLEGVYDTGIPVSGNATLAMFERNGQMEEAYSDFVYTPLRQPDGTITGVMALATDVTKQALATKQLAASEAKFRSLVEEAPVATCLFVGRELTIEVANEAIITIWGKGRSVIGQPLAKALPELEGQGFLPILDSLFTTGITYDAKAALTKLFINGTLASYYFDFTYKPLHNEAGEVYAIICMAVDVTEQVITRHKIEESEKKYRTLSAELEQQVQARTHQLQISVLDLERSNQNLQQFAYVASHDLQEPLRKIKSFGDVLRNQYGERLGEGADLLSRMQTSATRMSTLIRDLLAFSSIATQQDTNTLVLLKNVVGLILSDLDLLIQETGAVVTVDPLPTIQGDKSQLGQLFQNLLNNALKFRRAGVPPVINVTVSQIEATDLPPAVKPTRLATTYHCINVSDNGIGFDQQYVDRIFQVFQRLHGKSQFAGTGIGLAICEKVAANHGGAITAHSKPGEGATFSVYLPM